MMQLDLNILLFLPIIGPMFFAVLMIFFWKNVKAARFLNMLSSSFLLAVSIILFISIWNKDIHAVTAGGWTAPYGITLVADVFSALMILITGIIGFTTSLLSLGAIDEDREKYFYYPLIQLLLMGIAGSFLTGDIFNLYVWFEVMLISSFVLMSLGGKRDQLEGAIKYVTINLISSVIFLSAVGMTYGITGTLNMADLAGKIPAFDNQGLVNVISMLFLIAFGIKSAIFPLFFWLPASYHTPPSPVTALFAGLLTKVGVYAMFRVFTLIFIQDIDFTHTVILFLAGFTMVIGVLGAVAQSDFRRILSFHIVSQVGYMIMALALFSPLAIAAGIFYIIHHIFAKTNLFVISGVAYKMKGTYNLENLGGLYKNYPFFSLMFLIAAFSLAGIPPFSGFWGKLMLAFSGFDLQQYIIVGVSLFVSLLTLFSMAKIWNLSFWKNDPSPERDHYNKHFKAIPLHKRYLMYAPIITLAAVSIFIGLGADFIFSVAEKAAAQLKNPEIYINAVFGVQK